MNRQARARENRILTTQCIKCSPIIHHLNELLIQILVKIEGNMTQLGYTKAADPANAHLVLFPAVWTNTTIYYYYDYWCWYYPYYCGWGWRWYYPTVSLFTTGTLLMTLVADGDEYVEPTQVWTAAVNGLMSGAYNTTRVNNAIYQAF
jgi:hypothetical protein